MTLRPLAALAAAAVAIASLCAGPASAATSTSGSVTPVSSFSVSRYLGHWYQIADIPQWYEALCSRNTNATYSLNSDGTVKVVNRCTSAWGSTLTVNGGAKPVDSSVPASLEVSFLNVFGRQLYFGSANYVVIAVAPDYSWAVVGEPNHQSGYVLSRTPTLSASVTAQAKAALTAAGYQLSSFRYTPQDSGAASSARMG